jgi:hypothetical protein
MGKIKWLVLAIALIGVGLLASAEPEGTSRLVSVQQLPDNISACEMWDQPESSAPDLMASSQEQNLFDALQKDPTEGPSDTLTAELQPGDESPIDEPQTGAPQSGAQQAAPRQRPGGGYFTLPNTAEQLRVTAELRAHGARLPLRTIRDTAPTYSSVAVDVNSNEVIMTDNNLWSYRVFDRMSPTPATDDAITQPKRIVTGDKTALQFNNGLYVDPVNGDIFSVESDTGDKMVRFPGDASGEVAPKAVLHTPHRVYNLAADEVKQEIFATVEYPPQVAVYRKDASGEEKPLRTLEGDDTGLDAPHGIAVDEKDRLLFVNTWGDHSDPSVAGTGKWFPPAIKVFALDASGDAKPLHVITGEKTQLDWPAAMKFNPNTGDLYVANDIGQSVLVFANAAKAQGDAAPARVLHGPSTRLRNPTGVALDLKNQELWVSNLGNSSATVYPLMADGDTAPLRVIRSAEESKRGVNFGRTAAVTYDPIRQEILVPN